MNPKDNLDNVYMIATYDAKELFKIESNFKYALTHAEFEGYGTAFIFSVEGTHQEFMDKIKKHSEQGCSQELISHLKHARDIGVAWAVFYL